MADSSSKLLAIIMPSTVIGLLIIVLIAIYVSKIKKHEKVRKENRRRNVYLDKSHKYVTLRSIHETFKDEPSLTGFYKSKTFQHQSRALDSACKEEFKSIKNFTVNIDSDFREQITNKLKQLDNNKDLLTANKNSELNSFNNHSPLDFQNDNISKDNNCYPILIKQALKANNLNVESDNTKKEYDFAIDLEKFQNIELDLK